MIKDIKNHNGAVSKGAGWPRTVPGAALFDTARKKLKLEKIRATQAAVAYFR